jgi:predicted TIM-barrel fold metal-dependent hydrolase
MSTDAALNPRNAWRTEAPERDWASLPDADAPSKYFMVSTDAHAQEPFDFLQKRVPQRYRDRIPHMVTDDKGSQWLHVEGWEPQLVKPAPGESSLVPPPEEYEDFEVLMTYTEKMEPEDIARANVKPGLATRLANLNADGVDYELCFTMKGLPAFATRDPEFLAAMCHGWNEWALEEFGDSDRILPMAMIGAADVDLALNEIDWVAQHRFKGVLLPNRPEYGPVTMQSLQYNDKRMEPLWARLEETGLVATFHVSTGQDPRSAGGRGGALINYVIHSMATTMEPIVHMIASGVFVKHPKLIAGAIESGVGWVPWALESLDHGYKAHHMWMRPVIPELPSTYFRSNCFATFIEDYSGLALMEEFDLADNFCWSNDYPHQEGSWPHSAATIRRNLAGITEESRRKVLGLNAARIFGLPAPPGTS